MAGQNNSNENKQTPEEKNQLTPYVELDDLVGHFGWFQALLIGAILITKPFIGINGAIPVFEAARPNFRCATCFDNVVLEKGITEDLIDSKFFDSDLDECGSITIDNCRVDPKASPKTSSNNSSSNFSSDQALENCCYSGSNCSVSDFEDIEKSDQAVFQICNEYVYDRSIYSETIVTEFDLVCDRAYLADLSTSMYYVGVAVGSLAGGYVSSNYGRKIVILTGCFGCIAVSFWTSLCHSIELFIVAKGFNGFFIFFLTMGTFPYIMEISGAKWRSKINGVFGCGYAVGEMLLSWPFAYYFTNWHNLHFVITFLMFPAAMASLFLPESYRWLISQNRVKEAKTAVLKIAEKQNVLTYDEKIRIGEIVEEIAENSQNDEKSSVTKKAGFFDIFKFKNLRAISFTFMCVWFVNSFVYFGLVLNAGGLPGSDIINNLILSSLEIPAYLLSPILIDAKKIGRKYYMAYGTLAAGVCCILSTVCLEFKGCEKNMLETVGSVFAYVGKFFITGTFGVIYIHTSEAYSADVRPLALGICGVAARVGGVLAPFILSSSGLASWLPGAIFGLVGISGGLVALLLPETLGQPMLSTIEEAEEYFGKT